jgi:hypothetical protein
MYMMTFQGAMALGSILWGFIAEHSQTQWALTAAAAGILAALPFVGRYKILQGPIPDFSPYQFRRAAPALVSVTPGEPDPNEGPVRISIEYRIPLDCYADFTRAIHQLKGVRLRDGALRWGIYRDADDPTHLNETFVMESWIDYLRSRERTTAADTAIRDRVYALHQGDGPPRVTHQIYAKELT